MRLKQIILTWNEWFEKIGKAFQPTLLLAFRLFWGMLLFYSGLENFGSHEFLDVLLADLHFPFPELMVHLFIFVQIAGGIFLMLGFMTGIASLLIASAMVVALLTAHLAATTNVLAAPYNFITERPVSYLVVALVLFAFGPGSLSFDYVLIHWLKSEKE